MLRKIGLTNFKSWRELDIELAPITLLFGVNSSGKTALLQSLLMLKQTVNSRDPNTHLNFGGGPRDYVDLGSYRDLVNGHDESQPIGMKLGWDIPALRAFRYLHEILSGSKQLGPYISLEHSVTWRWDDDVLLDHLGYRTYGNETFNCFLRFDRLGLDNYRVTHSDSIESISATLLGVDEFGPNMDEFSNPASIRYVPRNCYLFPDGFRLANYWVGNEYYRPEFEGPFENEIGKIRYLGPLRQYPQRYYVWTGERKTEIVELDGSDTFAVLVSSQRDDGKLVAGVEEQLRELGLIQELRIRPAGPQSRFYEIMVVVTEFESSLLDVGFGVSQVLPIITMLLSAPEGSIILLEQPELHLHPNAQAGLADLMLHAAETRKLQLIVESHSEHIVRRLQRRVAEADPPFARHENIKMYFCQPGEHGSTISEVCLDRFGQIRDWPERFLGDISGDLHSMLIAALDRRNEELERV